MSAVVMPMFQIGAAHKVSTVITPCTVDFGGTLTPVGTAAVTCIGTVKSEKFNKRKETVNIRPLGSMFAHNVVHTLDWDYKLDVLKVNNGGDPSPLESIFDAFDIFKFVSVEGEGANTKIKTGYGVATEYDDGMEGEGEQIASITFKQVDAGAQGFVVSFTS